jgi:hypothetical protein
MQRAGSKGNNAWVTNDTTQAKSHGLVEIQGFMARLKITLITSLY